MMRVALTDFAEKTKHWTPLAATFQAPAIGFSETTSMNKDISRQMHYCARNFCACWETVPPRKSSRNAAQGLQPATTCSRWKSLACLAQPFTLALGANGAAIHLARLQQETKTLEKTLAPA